MRFKDQLAFVTQHMKKNKLRVTMTVMAAMIGCAFLIVLASIGFGMQETMRNEILNQEQVTEISLFENSDTLAADKMQWLMEQEHVNTVLDRTNLSTQSLTTFEDRSTSSNTYFYDIEEISKLPSNLAEGRLPANETEVVVGYHFAQTLVNEADLKEIDRKNKEAEQNGTWYDGSEEGYKGELIGQQISVQMGMNEAGDVAEARTFTVVGIEEKPTYEWETDNALLFSKDVIALYEGLETNLRTTVYVDSMENVLPLLDKMKEKGIQSYSPLEQMDEIDLFFNVLKAGLIFVGTIAVFIASIGIFNTMTMAVTERTREIGVLKAIGTSPALIQRLFLMESAFIGLLGTALAVAISYAISFGANLVLPHILSFALSDADISSLDITFSVIPPSLVIIAAFISFLVALISGWRPARKATRIEVIQALRQEL